MKKFDYKQRMMIIKTYEKAILEQYPKSPTGSGIYILTRNENGENKAYIGQSIHILQRMAEHMIDYKGHIDRSLNIYGLKTILNPKGWKLETIECEKAKLDTVETNYIADFLKKGYEVYNKTSGGQGEGKRKIAQYKEAKGYRKGVDAGYEKARKEISLMFKYLKFYKAKDGKINERMYEKFSDFLIKED